MAAAGIAAFLSARTFVITGGVIPEKGIIAAIITGIVISFSGGSRVQTGKPAGDLIIIVYCANC